MEKDKSLKANNPNTGAESASLLPYKTPELSVYNQARITLGGIVDKDQDYINLPVTSYKLS